MDTLKGLIYLETCGGIDTWCLAVEEPGNSEHTRIFKCKGIVSVIKGERKISSKKAGHWRFKVFRFRDIEKVETIEVPVTCLMGGIDNLIQQFPISELKKLKEWTD